MISKKCEICNDDLKIFKKLNSFNILECSNCNHKLSDIRTNDQYFKKTYSKNYTQKKHKNWMNNPNIGLFEKIYKFIILKKIKGEIIDLGCGKGLLLKYLNKKNSKLNLTGVDLYKNTSDHNLKFIKKNILEFSTKRKFSLVISIAVIEHIEKLSNFLRLIKRISKKGVYVIILTVNTNSILYKMSEILFFLNLKQPFIRLYDPHHINHFSKKSLKKIFIKNKFEFIDELPTPIKMKYVDFSYNNLITKYFYYCSLFFIFKFSKILNLDHLQTLVFKKK